jgi:hypothetical protein
MNFRPRTSFSTGSMGRSPQLFSVAIHAVVTFALLAVGTVPAHSHPEEPGKVAAPIAATPADSNDLTTTDDLVVPTVRDDFSSAQWYLDTIGASRAHELGTTGAGIVIAVLADGVDDLHPDLIGKVLPGWNSVTRRPVTLGTSNSFGAPGYTGTFQAGVLAASKDGRGLTGIAPDAKILPVVVDDGAGFSDRVVAQGIRWASSQGANVITVAFGVIEGLTTDGVSLTCAAITEARRAGTLTFVPSQNDEVRVSTRYLPATCADAVVVTSVDELLTNPQNAAIVGTPSFTAPGGLILGSVKGDDWLPYTTSRSTNHAAITAAGAAALVMAARSRINADDVVALLQSSATDLGETGADSVYGAGLIDVAASLEARVGTPIADRLTRIVSRSVPVIVDVNRDDEGNTSVAWEPPVGVVVDSYTVNAYRYTRTGWVASTYPFDAKTVRAVIPFDLYSEAYITVTAFTAVGNRTSAPTNTSGYDPADPIHERDSEDAAVTSATSRWTKDGIVVDVVVNDTTRAWDLVIIDLSNGEILKRQKVSGVTSRTVAIALTGNLRTIPLLVGAGIGRNGIDTYLLPYYGLTASVVAAGKSHAGVFGYATCVSDGPVDCGERLFAEGTVVKILDAKTRKQLATARIRSDRSYSAVWKHQSKRFDVIVEAKNGERSPREQGSFFYR